jgi:hypothetical protein
MTDIGEEDETRIEIAMKIVALTIAATGLSFVLAVLSWILAFRARTLTLGMLVWNVFDLPDATGHGYVYFSGANLFRRFAVDWAFWFVLLGAFYWLCRRWKRKSAKP